MAVTSRRLLAAGGWIYVYDIQGRNGVVVSAQSYQDAGDNILQSCTASGNDLRVYVRASYPLVNIYGVVGTLTRAPDSGFYAGYVDITLTAAGNIVAKVTTPDSTEGPHDTVIVAVEIAPAILTLSFIGGYPGSQTELKAGDAFQIHGTTDRPCVGVEILDFGACQHAVLTFASTTSFTVAGVIADRGTAAVARPARLRARNAAGAYGATRDTNSGGGSVDGTDVVTCNNLHPTVTFGAVTYPTGQTALKNSESASVVVVTANLDTILYDSPNSQLVIIDPTAIGSPKIVTRIAGNYNVATNNLRAEAVRSANDAHTIAQTVVRIAHIAAVIVVTEPYARLRAGNPNGDYTCSISSDQELPAAPSLLSSASPNSGVLQGAGWVGGLLLYTRVMRVTPTDVPGTYGWRDLSATNRAGIVTTSITGDANYVIGGFTARSVTFPAFSQTTLLGVAVVDYAKLRAGIFTATNQPSIKNPTLGNHDDLLNTYTIEALGVNPTTVFWNDLAAANANSSGTAQLLDIEELV